jgi:hypothetical protein
VAPPAWIALAALASAAGPGGAAVSAGQRLYRDGLLGSGAAVEGVVSGDVPVTGTQLACATCHGRSGLGSAEGGRVAPPVTGQALRAPRGRGPRPRPGYDDAALARALRDGVDARGRPLDPLMPRYRLADADVAALAAYLDALSRAPSPGVSAQTLHLATVIAPDAPAAVRAATLDVAARFVAAQNDAARLARVRHPRGERGDRAYAGEWVLHPWSLRGPPAGWRAQLEAQYRAAPVFALVSGAGGAEWGPVQAFCEERGLPCLLPNVDSPPAGCDQGWYAMYFSRGAIVEAEAIAADLVRRGRAHRVVQVHRPDAAAAAGALSAALRVLGRDAAVDVRLGAREPLGAGDVAARARRAAATAVVLWLSEPDLAALAREGVRLAVPVYVSATSSGGQLAAARGLGGELSLARPWASPGDVARRFRASSVWLASRGVADADDPRARRAQDQTLFAFRLFSQAFMHLNGNHQRDFLLEVLDHVSGIEVLSAHYPRLALGPSRRVLSKGCHVVALSGHGEDGEWIVP